MNNLVSVIIPVYNGERYLAEAIQSILAQTYPEREIVVVDDGSTDSSARVAGQFAVRYVFQQQAGAGAARNRGVESAEGDFFAFLDADDLWTNDKLRLQMDAFATDPELDVVFGRVEQFHSPELDAATRSKIHCPPGTIPGYSPSAMLIKRPAFEQVGPFETGLRLGEWLGWYLRATEAGLCTLMLPDLVVRRRLHHTNQGIREREARIEYVRALKASLDRRRATEESGR
jgi:glycosyltransferase involved in cell wall biosynthesis